MNTRTLVILVAWILSQAGTTFAQDTNAPSAAATLPVFKTADGKCDITLNTTNAPELKGWAETNLLPVLVEWYPKIVAMLPSEGYTAPARFSVTLKPMDGVAFTSGRRIVANSTWLQSEIGREAVGSIVHEAVHVAQQYHGGHNPGWLVEGIPDYIRWFKYEPQSHGADTVWMSHRRNFTPKYDASYRVTANFLNWVTDKYDTNIVSQLNAAMRSGTYDDALWKQYTGKTDAELGEEWKTEIEAQLSKTNSLPKSP